MIFINCGFRLSRLSLKASARAAECPGGLTSCFWDKRKEGKTDGMEAVGRSLGALKRPSALAEKGQEWQVAAGEMREDPCRRASRLASHIGVHPHR